MPENKFMEGDRRLINQPRPAKNTHSSRGRSLLAGRPSDEYKVSRQTKAAYKAAFLCELYYYFVQ